MRVDDPRVARLEAEVKRLREDLHHANARLNHVIDVLDRAGLIDTSLLPGR